MQQISAQSNFCEKSY